MRIFLNTTINFSVENIRHNIGYKLFSGYLKQDSTYHKETDNSELGKVILADVDQFIIFVLRPFVDSMTSLVIFIAIALYLIFFIDISSPPAWGQGYHLSNLFKMYNKSSESEPIIEILEAVINITNFKFLNAYQILS